MAAEKMGKPFTFTSVGAGFSTLVRAAVFVQSASNDGVEPAMRSYLPKRTPSSDLTQRRPLPRRRRYRHGGVFTGGPVTACDGECS